MKRTAKQRVRAKFPTAYAYRWGGTTPWVIYAAKNGTWAGVSLNLSDTSATKAWEQAARYHTVTGKRA